MIKQNKLSVAQQYVRFKRMYPDWDTSFKSNKMITTGSIQPTPMSCVYTVKITYATNASPKITILDPPLTRNFNNDKIPHMYDQKRLCTYYPKSKDWTPKEFIADKVVPWVSLWLYYYEVWHVTGEWLGGGMHPK